MEWNPFLPSRIISKNRPEFDSKTNQSILQSIGHSMASGLKDSAFKQINTRFFTKKLIILPRNFNFHGSDNKNGWNRDRSRLLKSKWGNFQIIYLQNCEEIKLEPTILIMISFVLLIWILKTNLKWLRPTTKNTIIYWNSNLWFYQWKYLSIFPPISQPSQDFS